MPGARDPILLNEITGSGMSDDEDKEGKEGHAAGWDGC